MRITRVVGGLLVLCALGCQFPYPADVPDDDAPTGRALGGAVSGLWLGATITLRLAAGEVAEDLAIAGEPFTFAARIPDGTSFLVTVADDGPDHDCVVTNGSGRIDGADRSDIDVACTSLIAHGLSISTAVPFIFDPRTTRYTLDVSILQQETAVTVTGPSLTSATVAGQAVVIGQTSAAVALGSGQTSVPVVVSKGMLSQRYELIFDRGAAPMVEAFSGRASNAEQEDAFGTAVAASGDLVVVGTPGEDGSQPEGNDNNSLGSGAVYAFRRAGATWTPTQLFRGSTVSTFRSFGAAVALDGDVLVVGAPGEDRSAMNDGAAYVFRFDSANGRWSQQQKLTASDPHRDDSFGAAVAVRGERIVIGAPGHDAGIVGSNVGLLYVYRWDGATWSEEARIRQPSPQMGDQLGTRLVLDSDTIAVGRGAVAEIYRRSGLAWNREGQVARGYLSLDGDTLVVGQPTDASGNGQPGDTSAPGSGALRVYTRSGAAWSETAYLKASPPQIDARLGTGVAIYRNVIVTGATGTHALHAFQRVGGSWVAASPLTASAVTSAIDGFGNGIALTGVGAVVGALDDDGPVGNVFDSGTAWFFR